MLTSTRVPPNWVARDAGGGTYGHRSRGAAALSASWMESHWAIARGAGRGVRRWARSSAGMGSSAARRGLRSAAVLVVLIIACLAQMRTALAREAVLLDVSGAIGPATTAYVR